MTKASKAIKQFILGVETESGLKPGKQTECLSGFFLKMSLLRKSQSGLLLTSSLSKVSVTINFHRLCVTVYQTTDKLSIFQLAKRCNTQIRYAMRSRSDQIPVMGTTPPIMMFQ